METDGELLSRYVEHRAEEAFAALVQRHVNLVFRAALRQCGGDAHCAEEATQVVFTLLARKAAKLTGHPSLTGWLYTTTHFTVSDLRRREHARQRREREAHAMHEISKANGDDADWDRLRPVLDDAMQQLGERHRAALLARFFEGRSFGEIGAHLALSEDAARMRVERALGKLRAVLARRGVTSTGAALGLLLANEAAAGVPAGLATSVTGSALAAAAAGGGGGLGAACAVIFMKTKGSLLAAGVAAVLGVGFYFAGHSRLEAALTRETASQQQELARLRSENRLLQTRNEQMSAAAAPNSTAAAGSPADPIARLRALTDLIVEGRVGIDAIRWVNFSSNADIFGLRPRDDVAGRRSRELIEMFALSPEEQATLRELGERTKAEIARGAIAQSVVRRDGDRLSIDVRPGPAARDAYERMLAGLRQTLGEDRFGLARMIGWEASIENQMQWIGLSAFTFTVARTPAADRSGAVNYIGKRRDARGGNGGSSFASSAADLRAVLGPLGVLIPEDF